MSCQDKSESIAINEIQKLDIGARVTERLEPGCLILSLPSGIKELYGKLSVPPIFVRHIFPVQYTLPFHTLIDLPLVPARGNSFSVQARGLIAGNTIRDTAHALTERLIKQGFTNDRKNPDEIISLYFKQDCVLVGLSTGSQNLSSHNGGMRRFKALDDVISRAEFKLLEGIETFSIKLPASGRALDLGAAPGGWTRILAQMGLRVTAVDPSALDPRVLNMYGVTHFKGMVQSFPSENGRFDMMVNDMKMSHMESSRLMLDMSRYLVPGGMLFMTLKLPERKQLDCTKTALSLLEREYTIKGVRQLFNNRSEVSVYAVKKVR